MIKHFRSLVLLGLACCSAPVASLAQKATVLWKLGTTSDIANSGSVSSDESDASALSTTLVLGDQISVSGTMSQVAILSTKDESGNYQYQSVGEPFTQFSPSANVSANTIGHHLDFGVTVASGHTFKINKVGFDVARCGTDKGSISMMVKVGTAAAVTPSGASSLTPLRNNVDAGNPNGYSHFEFELPDYLVKNGESFRIFIFIVGIESTKSFAFRNVTIEGKLDEPVYSFGDLVKSASCSTGDLLPLLKDLKNGEQATWPTKIVGDPSDFNVVAKDGFDVKVSYNAKIATFEFTKAGEKVISVYARFIVTKDQSDRKAVPLKRGLLAIKHGGVVKVSWRKRATDAPGTKYYVYRDGIILSDKAIYRTNVVDPKGKDSSKYQLKVVDENGTVIDQDECSVWTDIFNYNGTGDVAYWTIPTITPKDTRLNATYTPNDAAVCDMDGDGEYEIVLKWDPSNSKDAASNGTTSNTFIDCYKLDGTRLWSIDLGMNIRSGAHTTPFLAYDFDQDGFGELIVKTAPNTVDGEGNYVIMGDDDPKQSWLSSRGKVESGPEYLSVFDGVTGAEITTIPYHTKYGDLTTEQWGDSKVNRSERYLACMAYLDGVHPSAIMIRGYYNGARVGAYDFDGTNLTLRWLKSDLVKGQGVYGEGAHSVNVADVDFDGKDEIVFGSAAIDHDGSTLYRTGLGHGDALHTGDFIPSRPGLETYMVHEDGKHGYDLRDARTGQLIYRVTASDDTGRGLIGDFVESNPGSEFFASCTADMLSAETGEVLFQQGVPTGAGINACTYWDGDLQNEWHDRGKFYSWNTSGKYWDRIGSMAGKDGNNATKYNPCVHADFLGDWREEFVSYDAANNYLIISTTVIPTDFDVVTLMDDRQYCEAIVWQNVGYNQPPHLSYDLVTHFTANIVPDVPDAFDPSQAWTVYRTPYTVSIPKGLKIFSAGSMENSTQSVGLKNVSKRSAIPAGSIILLYGTEAVDLVPSSLGANKLTNCLTGLEADSVLVPSDNLDYYVFQNGADGAGFYRIAQPTKVLAGDAFYSVAKSNQNPERYILALPEIDLPVVSGPTGCKAPAASDVKEAPAFDLTGRPVSEDAKICIKNGKLILNK